MRDRWRKWWDRAPESVAAAQGQAIGAIIAAIAITLICKLMP